jgi:hypothetical protein
MLADDVTVIDVKEPDLWMWSVQITAGDRRSWRTREAVPAMKPRVRASSLALGAI